MIVGRARVDQFSFYVVVVVGVYDFCYLSYILHASLKIFFLFRPFVFCRKYAETVMFPQRTASTKVINDFLLFLEELK